MDLHRNRKVVYIGLLSVVALVYLIKIFRLQILDSQYEQKAINNALNKIPIYPDRSIIYDRNGKLLVHNIAIYDLVVFPAKAKGIDSVAFCEIMRITGDEYHKYMTLARENSKKRQKNNVFNGSAVFMSNLTKDQYSAIQENLYRFPGFSVEPKTDRLYAVKGGAHILGYMGEVSKKLLSKDPYYRPGDLVGITGIENTYESYIRGVKGVKTVWQDRTYTERGEAKDNEFNSPAQSGPDFFSSIDFELQEFGESLLDNKRGSVVAIEPSTGKFWH